MSFARAALPLALACLLSACASPPNSRQGADRATAMADYQDCYSKGCLDFYTPGTETTVELSARNCMQQRGYSPSCGAW